ncbi:porin family protein [bacterium]|nr:porin family protein [bacterium]
MKTRYLLATAVCLMPCMANAAIPYRVQQNRTPATATPAGNDDEALAREHRFYIGGMYDFSMWQSYTDDRDVRASGKNTSSFEAIAGIRVYDTFRIEANYIRTRAKWGDFSMDGNTGFVNAIFDARIDSLYRLFYKQSLVPYVGAGAGLSWNTADNAHIDNKITPAAAAMAGLAIEMGENFAVDFGYRYMYMFTPKFDVVRDLAPTAHQFRVGARVNF